MSDAANPYQSPETAAVPVTPLVAQGTLTENMLIYLKQASPWLRFVGILGFITAGLTAAWGLISFAYVPLIRQVWDEIPAFGAIGVAFGAAFGGGMAVLSIGTGAIMFLLSLFIYRFGDKIRSYLRTGTDQELEQALKNNRSFWKFLGIFCIVSLAFVPVLIIIITVVMIVSAVT